MTPQTRLDRYEGRTEWPLAGVAAVFLVLYSVKVLARPAGPAGDALDYTLWAVYFVFVADYLARLYLAKPRTRWFFRHIIDFAIVVLPFLRPLRLLSLAVILNVLQRAVGHSIRGKVIVYTVCGAVLIIYAASLAIFDLEHDEPDGKIKTFADALWWSMTTVTTVGYGDLWPDRVGSPGRSGIDDRRYQPRRSGHRDAGVVDCAACQRGGHRQSGRDGRAYRRASSGNPAFGRAGRR